MGTIDLEFTHAHKETNGTHSVTMLLYYINPWGVFHFSSQPLSDLTLRQPRIIPLYPQWSNYRDNGIRDTTLKSDTSKRDETQSSKDLAIPSLSTAIKRCRVDIPKV